MGMNEKLLDIACCPVSRQPLRKADKSLLEKLNIDIVNGDVENHRGETLQQPLSGALITRDGARLYPVKDGLVALLEAESIALSPL